MTHRSCIQRTASGALDAMVCLESNVPLESVLVVTASAFHDANLKKLQVSERAWPERPACVDAGLDLCDPRGAVGQLG
jgi:hypothetical protein